MKKFLNVLLLALNVLSFVIVGYMSIDFLTAIFSGGTEVIGVALTLPVFLIVVGVDIVLSIINLIIAVKTKDKLKKIISILFIIYDVVITATLYISLLLIK